jgi:hypothetical protein
VPSLRPLKYRVNIGTKKRTHSDNKKVCTAFKDCPKGARLQHIRVQDLPRVASSRPVKRRRQNGLLVYLFILSYGMEPAG